MTRLLRLLLRLFTLLIGVAAVVIVLGGAAWYVWQKTGGGGSGEPYAITLERLEHDLLGLYLYRLRGDLLAEPADPSDDTPRTFVVELGQAAITVAWRLEGQGLITDSETFIRLVQYHGLDRSIDHGIFELRRNMTMEEILRELQHGRMPSVSVSIPEGWRAEQIAEALEAKGVVSAAAFMAAVNEGGRGHELLLDRPPGSPTGAEGFLFPDTYELPKDTDPGIVLELMLDTWETKVWAELGEDAAAYDMTAQELITLASIVEREAVVAEERGLIAGVFWNRLREGMPLQADPTVMYAKGHNQETGRWWNPMLLEDALTVDSPYNTYLYAGLPPGPICNPGFAAIKAVIEPTETSYLFFVAKGDGSHWFAETYEEHLRYNEMRGN